MANGFPFSNPRSLMRSRAAILAAAAFMVAAHARAAADSAEQAPDIVNEIRELKALILQQQDAIEALRQRVQSQQERLDQIESRRPGPVTAQIQDAAVFPPAPAPQKIAPEPKPESELRPATKWYDRIGLRGYAQIRYNRLFETNRNLTCEQCDRSIGDNNGLFIRRARMIFSGDITDRVYLYLQPDFASTSGSLHFGQLRDLYFDISLDKKKEYRIRVGQSKVPFGFENLQSSQNRLALDRADALNSAAANERDLGAYFFYAPAHIRQRFRYLVDSGLKGSGDYGVIAAGFNNGQTANRPEANNNLHTVARFSYPFEWKGGQIIEPGIQAYTGQYTVTERGASSRGPAVFRDRRAAFSFVLYPQPFGFQMEYNFGQGPLYNPSIQTIEARHLEGGYAQLMYRYKLRNHFLTPFFKAQHYSGGKKHEFDARRYLVRDQELGLEWQPNRSLEWTAVYTRSDRTFEDSRSPNNRQKGRLLRLQLQVNY